MNDPIVQILVPVVISLIASSGFWLAVIKRIERRGLQTELVIGLAHDRIHTLGLQYIREGEITQDEYENLQVYLYTPYEKLGGNGSAKRIMQEVDKLPIKQTSGYTRKSSKGANDDSFEQSLRQS